MGSVRKVTPSMSMMAVAVPTKVMSGELVKLAGAISCLVF
jgi:hypothetical protein